MENLRNLREIHDHNDTLHRFLGDAEAAIGNLIVLNDETKKERDAAQADATRYAFDADREKARAAAQENHLRDVNERLRERLACERVDAQRVVNDRDEARHDRDALRLRYDALFTQSTHLAREVDRLKNEKADRIEAKPSTAPIKVGDRVVNVDLVFQTATVIGFFDSVENVRFAAVSDAWGRPYFWRRDLCNPAPVST
jgi:hypothetical protein